MSPGGTPEEILALAQRAQELMQRHGVLPSPENYELWYAYASQRNEALVSALDQAVASGKASDLEQARLLYARFFAQGSSETQEAVGHQLSGEIDKLTGLLRDAGENTASFGRTLKSAGGDLAADTADIKSVVERLVATTRAIEQRNHALEGRLQSSMAEVSSLREKMEAVRKESLSDALTGLANRRCFDDRMREAAGAARREGKPLSLLIGDVDHFKKFNDTYGHATGDQVLKLVAQCFKQNVKGRDTAARFGGEEFCVILPETALPDAAKLAEQIRASVESKKIVKRSTGESLGSITLSLGAAQWKADEEIADLINRADACLYAAKRGGRNRVLTETQFAQAAPAPAPAAVGPKAARSTASLSFEYAVRALCRAGDVPLRSAVDLRHFHRFARWMVIVEPDFEARRMTMRLTGSGFLDLIGRDLTDTDYLQLIDADRHASVLASAREMLKTPCGLWQTSPAIVGAAAPSPVETTIFPILDDRTNKGQLLAYAQHTLAETSQPPAALRILAAQVSEWIDLGCGIPLAA
jgi:diguanylate cyclase